MKLSGSFKLDTKKEIVWKALNDSNILKKCIPGCDSFKKENETMFKASATNQIGPMNATFSGEIKLSNIKINESYTLSGEGQSSVGFANGSADVKLDEENGKTSLVYEVDINVGGKIAQLGSRLIDGVAKRMADYFFGRFADLVAPIKSENADFSENKNEKRVKELKSNFLNKYIYSILLILLLLLVAIIYFILSYTVNINVGGKIAQLGSRLIDGVAKKMSDYFFGRFSDIVDPINSKTKNAGEVIKKEGRVTELKSNFLNKYIYSVIIAIILLIVAIIYFVSR